MRPSYGKLPAITSTIVVALFLASRPASADFLIEFDDVYLSGGTVTQTGNIITGTDVLFDSILLIDTSTNTTLSLAQCGTVKGSAATACALNFTFDTGTSTGAISMTTLGGLYDSGADLLAFTGDDGGQFLAPLSEILSGSLTAAGFATSTTFGAEGFDTKNPALLDFFRLLIVGDFTLSTTEIRVASTGNVTDADLTNSGDILFIPEPGMLTLFGLGLFGVARRLTRRA